MTTDNVIGEFSDYDSLVAALRAARERRDISFENLDEVIGASRGYFSKVLALSGQRKVTMQRLCWLLAGLGVKAILIDDPEALKLTANQHRARDRKLVRVTHVHYQMTSKRWARIAAMGRKATKERWKRMSPEQRAEHGRRLALARWSKANGAAQ